MSIPTAVVPVEDVFALRWAVLRTGMPREAAVYPQDAAPETFHVAAYRAGSGPSGTVLACATFFPEPMPEPVAEAESGARGPAYRFRGMGSDPAVRGAGYGAAVLRAGLGEAARRGAGLAWCNGRTSARGFYERHGFTAVGEEFAIEGIGPHRWFVRPLGD